MKAKISIILILFFSMANSQTIEIKEVNLNDLSRNIEETLDKGEYTLNIYGEFEKDKFTVSYKTDLSTTIIDPIDNTTKIETFIFFPDSLSIPPREEFNKTFPFEIKNRSKFEVIIEIKQKDNGKIVSSYKIIFKSKVNKKWVTSFGVSSVFINSDTYRTLKQNDDTYKIVKDGNNEKLQVIPLMQFSFIDIEKDSDFTLTGGIGFDTENISVFAGGSYYIGQNIFITGGIGLHKQKQLNNLYLENQSLTEAIDESVLNKDYYRINPFISITYRLTSNIFKKK